MASIVKIKRERQRRAAERAAREERGAKFVAVMRSQSRPLLNAVRQAKRFPVDLLNQELLIGNLQRNIAERVIEELKPLLRRRNQ